MSAFIRAASKGQILSAETRPEFRRATRNMRLCASAAEETLKAARDRTRLGVVLGTNLGELETTTDFLTTWASQNLARPLLFQNSLHNATIGFLTLHFGIRGPSATISNRNSSPADSLDLALTWLADGIAEDVLVLTVDSPVARMPHARGLSDESYALLLSRNSDGAIASLDILDQPAKFQPGHGRNVIAELVAALETGRRNFTLAKPLRGFDLLSP
ncbi:MAG: beta-ketoacyl synthase chain length factor [Bdellovibrionia bacterium]